MKPLKAGVRSRWRNQAHSLIYVGFSPPTLGEDKDGFGTAECALPCRQPLCAGRAALPAGAGHVADRSWKHHLLRLLEHPRRRHVRHTLASPCSPLGERPPPRTPRRDLSTAEGVVCGCESCRKAFLATSSKPECLRLGSWRGRSLSLLCELFQQNTQSCFQTNLNGSPLLCRQTFLPLVLL